MDNILRDIINEKIEFNKEALKVHERKIECIEGQINLLEDLLNKASNRLNFLK